MAAPIRPSPKIDNTKRNKIARILARNQPGMFSSKKALWTQIRADLIDLLEEEDGFNLRSFLNQTEEDPRNESLFTKGYDPDSGWSQSPDCPMYRRSRET